MTGFLRNKPTFSDQEEESGQTRSEPEQDQPSIKTESRCYQRPSIHEPVVWWWAQSHPHPSSQPISKGFRRLGRGLWE